MTLRMPVFFAYQLEGEEALLDAGESRHLIRVLRLKEGDPVELVDGKGSLYRGTISRPDPENARVRIRETIRDYLSRRYSLHLAIAPTKSAERFEWFLEKATEIGVDEISPLICDRSQRRRIRMDRSQKIILTAMKQSGRAHLPELHDPLCLPEFLKKAAADRKFIAHCGVRPGTLPERNPPPGLSWMVLVGPEGDFTPEEVAMARSMGYREVSLGEAVYRTETAGIMACQLVHFLHVNP